MTQHPPTSWQRMHLINLLLAASSSLIEIGPIVVLIHEHANLILVLLAGLSYQLGNVLTRPVPSIPIVSACIAGTGAITLVASPVGSVMWLCGLATLSWGLQAIRRCLSITSCGAQPSTAQKRMARVGGFVLSAMLPFVASVILTTSLCLIVGISLRRHGSAPVEVKDSSITAQVHPIHALMVIHQMHYFSYCYGVPVIFAASDLGGNWLIGVWFALGWVSYLSAHWVLQRFRLEWVFVIGHAFVAVTLIGLSFLSGIAHLAIVMWILTGLGGGTVFCLTALSKQIDLNDEQLVAYEDIGHIGGIVLAVALTALVKLTASDLPLVAAALALMASIGMLTWTIRRRGGVASTTSQLTP